MAKKSAIDKNIKRRAKVAKFATKRAALKATIMDRTLPVDERFKATLALAECRVILPKTVFVTGVKSQVARALIIANFACPGSTFVSLAQMV